MIASMAAVGLGGSFGGGSSSRPGVPTPDEETPQATATPTEAQRFPEGPTRTIDATQPHKATLKTNKGEIEIQLFTDAPEAVNSFAFLAKNGFYDASLNAVFLHSAGDSRDDSEMWVFRFN